MGSATIMTSCNTRVLDTIESVRTWRAGLGPRADRSLVGLVPTMGALHEGHLALVRKAKSECRHVIASIFVNPMQFAPHEDYGRYPRTFEKDLDLLSREGVDAVFYPSVDQMYPQGKENCARVIVPSALGDVLEGHFRPGFFVGVATVCNKLFNIVQPESVFFGEKDFQQLLVIKTMVRDLDMPITVFGVPTVREADGLALSSRNVYLAEKERTVAPILQRTLAQVRDRAISGEMTLGEALEWGRKQLLAVDGLALQYLEARHAETFEELEAARAPMAILLAARLAEVRLIDNVVVR